MLSCEEAEIGYGLKNIINLTYNLERFTLIVDFEQPKKGRISSYKEARQALRPVMEADPCKKLRIVLFAHFIGSRLALDKLVLRVFLDKAQLCRKGPFGLPWQTLL